MTDLLTTKQVMDLLRLDRTTIYRMLNDGRLSAIRVGGQWRFSREALEQYLGGEGGMGNPSKSIADTSSPQAPTEVLPIYCLLPIQEVFAQTGEIGAVTTDLNGKPLTPVSNSCAYCNLILSTEQGHAQCVASWKQLAAQTDQQPRLAKCHAGLTYARGRVIVQNQFVAMFCVGQFTVEDRRALQTRDHLTRVARACNIDEQELAHAAKDIRVLASARAERLLNLLQMVADTYSHIGEERLDLLTRLKKVAEIAGVSTST